MLEIRLIVIFAVCAALLTVSGIIIAGSRDDGKAPHVFLVLPVTENTQDIEFLVRECVYKAAELYPQTVVLLCDYGADKDTIRVFEKLMRFSCKYYILDRQKVK